MINYGDIILAPDILRSRSWFFASRDQYGVTWH